MINNGRIDNFITGLERILQQRLAHENERRAVALLALLARGGPRADRARELLEVAKRRHDESKKENK